MVFFSSGSNNYGGNSGCNSSVCRSGIDGSNGMKAEAAVQQTVTQDKSGESNKNQIRSVRRSNWWLLAKSDKN